MCAGQPLPKPMNHWSTVVGQASAKTRQQPDCIPHRWRNGYPAEPHAQMSEGSNLQGKTVILLQING